jgi:pantothenate kinase type III
MRVVATGGLAPLFHGTAAAIDDVDADITLRGLKRLYDATQDARGKP